MLVDLGPRRWAPGDGGNNGRQHRSGEPPTGARHDADRAGGPVRHRQLKRTVALGGLGGGRPTGRGVRATNATTGKLSYIGRHAPERRGVAHLHAGGCQRPAQALSNAVGIGLRDQQTARPIAEAGDPTPRAGLSRDQASRLPGELGLARPACERYQVAAPVQGERGHRSVDADQADWRPVVRPPHGQTYGRPVDGPGDPRQTTLRAVSEAEQRHPQVPVHRAYLLARRVEDVGHAAVVARDGSRARAGGHLVSEAPGAVPADQDRLAGVVGLEHVDRPAAEAQVAGVPVRPARPTGRPLARIGERQTGVGNRYRQERRLLVARDETPGLALVEQEAG